AGTPGSVIMVGSSGQISGTVPGLVVDGNITALDRVVATGDFELRAGASLNMALHHLQILGHGSFHGLLTNANVLELAGVGRNIRGLIASGRITGSVILDGDLVVDSLLDIDGPGASIRPNGRGLRIGQLLRTRNGGALEMSDSADSVQVDGAADFFGGRGTGMSAGVLRVRGGLRAGHAAEGAACDAFSPGRGHRLVLDGGATQTVEIDCADSGLGTAEFTNPAGVTLQGAVRIKGPARVLDGTVNGSAVVTLEDTLSDAQGGRWRPTTHVRGNGALPDSVDAELVFMTGRVLDKRLRARTVVVADTATLELGGQELVADSVEIGGTGRLRVAGGRVSVKGGLGTRDSGVLVMQDAADVVEVRGTAHFGGGSLDGLLTDGLLELGGDVRQTGSCTDPDQARRFRATGSHRTVLKGASQNVDLVCGGDSRFATLEVEATTTATFTADSTAVDTVRVRGAASGTGKLLVEGDVTGEAGSSVTMGTVRVKGALAAAGAFDVDTTEFAGTGQAIDSLAYNNVVVTGDAVAEDTLTLAGSLEIRGNGARFSAGGKAVTIGDSLRTRDGGILTMKDHADSVVVGKDATFAGGSTTDSLTAGVLEVRGNLRQEGGGSSLVAGGGFSMAAAVAGTCSSFAPSGTHRLRLTGGAGQIVELDCPSGSGLNEVVIDNPTTVSIVGTVPVAGPVRVLSGTVDGGGEPVLQGTLEVAAGAKWSPFRTRFRGTPALSLARDTLYTNAFFESSYTLGDTLNVVGSLELRGAVVRGNGSPLTVFGDLVVDSMGTYAPDSATTRVLGSLFTRGSGTLEMTSTADVVEVQDSAVFGGGDTAGSLTAGLLRLRGTFAQVGACAAPDSGRSFAATGNHRTELAGGTGLQVVSFECVDTTGIDPRSRFQELDVETADSVHFATTTVVEGSVDVKRAGQGITGGPNVVIGQNLTDAHGRWRAEKTTYRGKNPATPSTHRRAVTYHDTVALSAPAVYEKGLTLEAGRRGQTITVAVMDMAGHDMQVVGDLRIRNSATLDLSGGTLTVTGVLILEDSATLTVGTGTLDADSMVISPTATLAAAG
ncbi:MAG: hypothetical protein WEB88_00410, partial [Gemmatimonadota bacterium]